MKTKRKQAQGVDIAPEVRGHRVGKLLEWSARGPVVDWEGNPHGPIAARSTVALGAARVGREVLIAFEAERSDRPIVVGLLQNDAMEATVDGKRVVIEGQDEIVLRCGAASITLRRNGRVVVRGAYVETRAEGVNRIKGGSVKIN